MRLSRLCSFVFAFAILFFANGCKEKGKDSIPVVGLDSSGKEIQDTISMEKYSDAMGITLSAFNKKMGESIKERQRSRSWNLSIIIIGLAIGHGVGFGLTGVNVTPTVVLFFFKR